MLSQLKKLFTKEAEPVSALDEKTTAVAALMIEAALSDETYCETEKEMVISVLKRHFDLNDADVNEIVSAAEKAHADSDQILSFTRTVKETVEFDDRVHIVEMLWEIVYADGVLSDYEANLLRRICGLIYVDDVESGKARKRVLARLGISG